MDVLWWANRQFHLIIDIVFSKIRVKWARIINFQNIMESIRLDIIKESNELYIASSPDVKELNFRNNNIPALLEKQLN